MGLMMGLLPLLLWVVMFHGMSISMVGATAHHRQFVLKEASYTRLCKTKSILTVNGSYPGPTLHVHKGDTLIVKVINRSKHNVTFHWHGVKQPRNPWSDGPEYITQCPIQPNKSFAHELVFSNEEGTLWWHAHSDWTRATVHGVIAILPANGTTYPFPKPYKEVPLILGEWWKADIFDVLDQMKASGGAPNISDAFTINGQPGDLLPCSKNGTFRLTVESNKTYLLRTVNAALHDELFFGVKGHRLTVLGVDGSYLLPFQADYIMIPPGQVIDVLLEANQSPGRYYIAAKAYSSGTGVDYDNTTATAIIEYINASASAKPSLPLLPAVNDTAAASNFTQQLRSLNDASHPADVPKTFDKRLLIAISVKLLSCPNNSCEGPNGSRLAASMNNISFVTPNISILQAYSNHINGVYGGNFPERPPYPFNFTGEDLPLTLLTPKLATEVKYLDFNSSIEIVYQGTSLVAGENHPMHLHGFNYYLVGFGFGNWDPKKDPQCYNLINPPKINTVGVPKNGWAAIRFRADNPGVWFNHCHLERHLSWGMVTAFIVKNGKGVNETMKQPPPDMPTC